MLDERINARDVELLLHHQIEHRNHTGPRRVQRVAPDALRALLPESKRADVLILP